MISTPIGVGGMGEVYRAHDTSLDRDVAIKILPDALAADSDRLARFRREAHVLASLNHPNIATIHGLEESGGVYALVLELVEGPTLEDWIATRSLRSGGDLVSRDALAESLAIARQIAEALDSAHERGIVHRDLKPANVKIAPDGRVKVLDFGLAKVREPATGPSHPTVTGLRTDAGVVLGTVPYMSPEQARGTAVDRRTDVWAFGCILYELLTGRRAFPSGETASDTLAAVLALDPDWAALPAATPARLRLLVERCLEKDPRGRLRDIGDTFRDLQDALADVAPSGAASKPLRRREYALGAIAVLAVAIAALVAAAASRAPAPDRAVVAFTVQAPLGGELTVAQPLSPDGSKLAFIAASGSGVPVIWVRSLDSIAVQPLPGTEGASGSFWSPDSQHLGFFADEQLKRVPANGGAAQVICALDIRPVGGSWGKANVILVGQRSGPVMSVSAAGGDLTPVTAVRREAGEQGHTTPDFLPDGRRFIFITQSGGLEEQQAYIGSLDSRERLELRGIRSAARYAATSHVLFTRENALLAQPLDVERLELSGEPFQVAARAAANDQSPFSVAADGTLAYLALPDIETELRWFDRTGAPLGVAAPRGSYLNPALSPDDNRIAVDIFDQGGVDIWTIDSAGRRRRVTADAAADFLPTWSRDNRTIVFTSYRGGLGRIYRRDVDAAAGDTLVQETMLEQRVSDWSSDGKWIAYAQQQPAAGDRLSLVDLFAATLEGERETIDITQTEFREANARFSPDVRWVAYESNESGRVEVYVQAFPHGAAYPVSAGGGRAPRWSPDGAELFYLTDDGTVWAVSVSRVAGERFGTPTRLFRANVDFAGLGRALNVSSDGSRFLLTVVPADRAPSSIVVMHNWAARLSD